LAAAGAQVAVAGSAEDALRMLADGPAVDVIVSDIGMPGMDGYELLRTLRSLGGGIGLTPAIALTAYGRAEDAARARASGYQQHLTKPISAARLVAAVWHVLAPDASRV
jgi:CheY-like chemotaxis protein